MIDPNPRWDWLRHFSRITAGGELIREVDGLRCVAIGTVILHHLASFAGDAFRPFPGSASTVHWLHTGAFGVQLFFVISGFILGVPFARHFLVGDRAIPIRAYFWRRITRLEPPYLLALALLFVLKVGVRGESAEFLFPRLVASAVYLHNLIFNETSAISGVAWSLEVEFQFYALAPLFAQVFRIQSIHKRRATLVAIAATILVAATVNPAKLHEWHLSRSILTSAHYFLAGMLLSDLYVTTPPPPRLAGRGSRGLDLLCLALLVVPFVTLGSWPFGLLRETINVCCVATAYWLAFHSLHLRSLLAHPLAVTLGGMCYSLYLTHNSAILGVGALLKKLPSPTLQWVLLPVLGTVASLVVGAAFFRLIERPTMRRDWPQRLAARF